MNVCQRNVARFDHVERMFDKISDIFQGFGNLLSLRLQKPGRTYRTGTPTALAPIVRSYYFFIFN